MLGHRDIMMVVVEDKIEVQKIPNLDVETCLVIRHYTCDNAFFSSVTMMRHIGFCFKSLAVINTPFPN